MEHPKTNMKRQNAETENEKILMELRDALQEITDHFAAVMNGPMISGRGVTFANGVEGVPTIAKARKVLAMANGRALTSAATE